MCQKHLYMFFLPRGSRWPGPLRNVWRVLQESIAFCYWTSSHCIPAQKFLSVSAELNHNHSQWMLDSDQNVWCYCSSSQFIRIEMDSHSRVDKISTKRQIFCLSRNPSLCTLEVNGITLQQMERFKYLGNGVQEWLKAEQEDWFTNWQYNHSQGHSQLIFSGGAKWIQLVVVPNNWTCFKNFWGSIVQLRTWTVFVPILAYDHESWVMTEKVISQVQAAKMGFFANSSWCDTYSNAKLWNS